MQIHSLILLILVGTSFALPNIFRRSLSQQDSTEADVSEESSAIPYLSSEDVIEISVPKNTTSEATQLPLESEDPKTSVEWNTSNRKMQSYSSSMAPSSVNEESTPTAVGSETHISKESDSEEYQDAYRYQSMENSSIVQTTKDTAQAEEMASITSDLEETPAKEITTEAPMFSTQRLDAQTEQDAQDAETENSETTASEINNFQDPSSSAQPDVQRTADDITTISEEIPVEASTEAAEIVSSDLTHFSVQPQQQGIAEDATALPEEVPADETTQMNFQTTPEGLNSEEDSEDEYTAEPAVISTAVVTPGMQTSTQVHLESEDYRERPDEDLESRVTEEATEDQEPEETEPASSTTLENIPVEQSTSAEAIQHGGAEVQDMLIPTVAEVIEEAKQEESSPGMPFSTVVNLDSSTMPPEVESESSSEDVESASVIPSMEQGLTTPMVNDQSTFTNQQQEFPQSDATKLKILNVFPFGETTIPTTIPVMDIFTEMLADEDDYDYELGIQPRGLESVADDTTQESASLTTAEMEATDAQAPETPMVSTTEDLESPERPMEDTSTDNAQTGKIPEPSMIENTEEAEGDVDTASEAPMEETSTVVDQMETSGPLEQTSELVPVEGQQETIMQAENQGDQEATTSESAPEEGSESFPGETEVHDFETTETQMTEGEDMATQSSESAAEEESESVSDEGQKTVTDEMEAQEFEMGGSQMTERENLPETTVQSTEASSEERSEIFPETPQQTEEGEMASTEGGDISEMMTRKSEIASEQSFEGQQNTTAETEAELMEEAGVSSTESEQFSSVETQIPTETSDSVPAENEGETTQLTVTEVSSTEDKAVTASEVSSQEDPESVSAENQQETTQQLETQENERAGILSTEGEGLSSIEIQTSELLTELESDSVPAEHQPETTDPTETKEEDNDLSTTAPKATLTPDASMELVTRGLEAESLLEGEGEPEHSTGQETSTDMENTGIPFEKRSEEETVVEGSDETQEQPEALNTEAVSGTDATPNEVETEMNSTDASQPTTSETEASEAGFEDGVTTENQPEAVSDITGSEDGDETTVPLPKPEDTTPESESEMETSNETTTEEGILEENGAPQAEPHEVEGTTQDASSTEKGPIEDEGIIPTDQYSEEVDNESQSSMEAGQESTEKEDPEETKAPEVYTTGKDILVDQALIDEAMIPEAHEGMDQTKTDSSEMEAMVPSEAPKDLEQVERLPKVTESTTENTVEEDETTEMSPEAANEVVPSTVTEAPKLPESSTTAQQGTHFSIEKTEREVTIKLKEDGKEDSSPATLPMGESAQNDPSAAPEVIAAEFPRESSTSSGSNLRLTLSTATILMASQFLMHL